MGERGGDTCGENAAATYRGGESRRHLPNLFGLSVWFKEKKRKREDLIFEGGYRERENNKLQLKGWEMQVQTGLGSQNVRQ